MNMEPNQVITRESHPSLLSLLLPQLRPALSLLVVFTLLTGLAYPLAITGLAGALVPHMATGSIIHSGDKRSGSSLIGQEFSGPRYFWGRLSATGPMPYNAASSSGSNYGPMNSALIDAAKARITALRAAEQEAGAPEAAGPVPQDLVTASGSGLDPHISPAAATYQATRVAKARGMSEQSVRDLISRHTEGRQFGIFGEPRVNILELNLALDTIPPASDTGVRQ
jgi:K+-transporting ATPase ATPase C chain